MVTLPCPLITQTTANNRAALWITSTTCDSQEDSDYEDPPLSGDEVDKQEPEPELHYPGRGFEDGGEHHDEATARFNGEAEDIKSDPEDSIMVLPGPPATSSGQYLIERYPGAGEPIGEAKELLAETTKLLEDPWFPFANVHDFKQARLVFADGAPHGAPRQDQLVH